MSDTITIEDYVKQFKLNVGLLFSKIVEEDRHKIGDMLLCCELRSNPPIAVTISVKQQITDPETGIGIVGFSPSYWEDMRTYLGELSAEAKAIQERALLDEQEKPQVLSAESVDVIQSPNSYRVH